MPFVRTGIKALACKIEATAGVDQIALDTGPAAADWIGCDFDTSLPQDTSDNPEVNGALDVSVKIAGGIKPTITIRVPLRGGMTAGVATPGVAPEWGRLMRACSYVETTTAAAVGTPTAISSGTVTALTLPASPFAATAQIYRGMPLLLSGSAMNAGATLVQDYTAARVASLIETLAITPTVAQLVQVPINVLYTASSDPALWKTVTIYAYMDGIRHRFAGCSGTWSLEMNAGKPAVLTFEMRGVLVDAYVAAAVPAGWNIARATPPLWINGKSQLARKTAKTDRARIAAQVTLADPENPEAAQGYDMPFPTLRDAQVELAPFADTVLSPTRFASFQAGQSVPFGAILGSVAGNRIGVTLPNGRITRFDMSDRQNLGVDAVTLAADGADLAPSLCVF